MKKSLMRVLGCPQCKGKLELKVAEGVAGEVISGELCCPKCSRCYPIEEGIPQLLPPGSG